MTELLMGHCQVKGHLSNEGVMDNLICVRYREKDKAGTHIIYDFMIMANVRFRHLGHYFM
jgi:hypothetical protein